MKFQKPLAFALITVIVSATLVLGFQQDPLRLPNPNYMDYARKHYELRKINRH